MSIRWRDREGKEWTTHEGLVLGKKTICQRVMSDIYSDETYAIVWNPEKGETQNVHIGSCFECFFGPWGSAEVDATDETRSSLASHEAKKAAERAEIERVAAAVRREEERKRPARGKTLRVVRGRKVPRGTVGECFWMGPDKFGNGYRVGIKDENGTVHWTAESNCEVVEEAA